MIRSTSSRRKLAALVTAGAASLAALAPAHAVTILGLTTTNGLTTFDSSSPTLGTAPITITGLDTPLTENIVGIDLRPTTGVVYGISDASKLYTLNPVTAVATKVGNLSPGLTGATYGVDFNPVADLAGNSSLRVVNDLGQNLAVNANTGAVTVQTPLNGGAAGAMAAAYTNNDTNPATGTTLYYIDADSDALYNTASPLGGTLTKIGTGLGGDFSGVTGFDIAGVTNQAFASLSVDGSGKSALYSINLATGTATAIGDFGILGNTSIAPPLLGLTITAVPEPETYAMMLAGLVGLALAKRRKA